MKYINLIICIMLFYNCNQSNNSNWEIIETEFLKHYQLSFDDIIILNSKEALLFGSEDTRENRQRMKEKQNLYHTGFAVIYKTKDGGKSWQKKAFNKGGFWHTCRSGNTLFATKTVNNGRLAEMTSVLYCSIDKGETWKKINEFIGQAAFIALDENINGYIGGLKSNKHQRNVGVYRIDKGEIKEQTNQIIYPAKWCAESNEILYFNQRSLCVFETNSAQLNEYRLPVGFDGYFAERYEDEFWVIGREDEQCCIYKVSEIGRFEKVYCFSSNEVRIFPKELKVFGSEIVAVIGARKSASVDITTFFSSDSGKSWQEENLLISRYLNPVDFILTNNNNNNNNNRIFGMGYSGAGRIQVRR